jgi:hypothetical protein
MFPPQHIPPPSVQLRPCYRRLRSDLTPQQVLYHRSPRQIRRLVERPDVQGGEYRVGKSEGQHQGDPACASRASR